MTDRNNDDVKFEKAVHDLYFDDYTKNGYVYFSDADLLFSSFNGKQQKNIELIKDYLILSGYKKKSKRISFLVDALFETIDKSKQSSKCIYNEEKIDFVTVNSVSEYLDFLKRLSPFYKDKFYRGQTNFKWDLFPSIYRNPTLVVNEKLMIDKMLQSNPEEFNFNTTFDILSKVQHYNLPTRLIDVTINPLVALYFAVNDHTKNEDGQVFVFTPDEKKVKYTDSDTVSLLANISKMDITFGNQDIGTDKIGRFIHFIRKEKPFFEDYLEENCLNDYVFVQGNYNNKRIAKQNGAFILVGVQDTKLTPTKVDSNCIIKDRPVKILVPYTKKLSIQKELELLSIHDGTLFPEIDNVANHIKNSILEI